MFWDSPMTHDETRTVLFGDRPVPLKSLLYSASMSSVLEEKFSGVYELFKLFLSVNSVH